MGRVTEGASAEEALKSLRRLREYEYDLFDSIVGGVTETPVMPNIPSAHAKRIGGFLRECGIEAATMVEEEDFLAWLEERE